MPSIVPMAVITLAASAALWGAMLWAYSGRTWRFVRLVPFGLPLSAVVNLLVKGPLGEGLGRLAGIEPGLGLETPVWFLLFLFALAPVFEELIKVLPALVPAVRRHTTVPDDAYWTGMALGIGFGLGEAAYLAWGIAASGAYEQYPWYAFTGYLGERLLVVFAHGFMTSLFCWLIARRKPVLGFCAAAGTHALLNTGAMLYQLGLPPRWVSSLWLVAWLIGCVLLFERIRPKTTREHTDHPDVVYYSADEP
ncbi:MAG: PrsW family glutamic-type intramembrane protease [Coriobacteriia bacterium]|nr:PrsW family glutamic-type intramembrane protease [Coriobacteriia bacterium]